MRTATMLLAAAAVMASAAVSLAAAKAAPEWVAAANNGFAADLYARLAAEKGNLFFSPNSIETALTMTYAGARGSTAAEMAKVLRLPAAESPGARAGGPPPAGPADIHAAMAAFLADLNAEKGPDGKPRGYQLSVANALWGQKGEPFLPDFLGLLKTSYSAGLTDLDFAKDAEAARKTINTWVEKQTRDKIKDLIKAGVLDRDTRLVLTNAIYFKGDWAEKFKKDATKDAEFRTGEPEAKVAPPVPMMNRTGDYAYTEDDSLQAVKLPYGGNELSMVVLLPKKVDGLAAVEKSLTPQNLAKWMPQGQRKVVLSLPKFKLTCEFELSKTLAAMGMADAFSDKADFSGMNGKHDLLISNVIHKAFVDVNEEGTEAAAATAVAVGLMSVVVEPPPVVFKADHPFIFLIRHEKTGAILFLGRVANPKA